MHVKVSKIFILISCVGPLMLRPWSLDMSAERALSRHDRQPYHKKDLTQHDKQNMTTNLQSQSLQYLQTNKVLNTVKSRTL